MIAKYPISSRNCVDAHLFVAIDVHLHNFLMRSGILQSLKREHKQGGLCFSAGYCKTAICELSKYIDLKNTLDSSFRTYSPRIVQFLIWLHCSDEGKSYGGGVCNRNNPNCMRCSFSSGEQCEKLSWTNWRKLPKLNNSTKKNDGTLFIWQGYRAAWGSGSK